MWPVTGQVKLTLIKLLILWRLDETIMSSAAILLSVTFPRDDIHPKTATTFLKWDTRNKKKVDDYRFCSYQTRLSRLVQFEDDWLVTCRRWFIGSILALISSDVPAGLWICPRNETINGHVFELEQRNYFNLVTHPFLSKFNGLIWFLGGGKPKTNTFWDVQSGVFVHVIILHRRLRDLTYHSVYPLHICLRDAG